ncbi:response regulator transcription factor [Simiduia agarivorans]|uniref:XRE family transcriptional regulator n=1 Tax=Simiduia agarivorans (strain DSM 21679 / JCM 13881 / BCRC 17597 / SA1) TaxID=1117647 RepID=K4KH22_SIMAS|nr:response regulator transcription factor [Simiduia agarivorans]AFU98404.2 XRE family transcriptional regulator [Simiduia agarivorans SA1 = DSM 21679]
MEILIIDDHALFREGLKILLAQLGPDVVVTEVDSGQAAYEATQGNTEFDVALLDYHLPDQDGLSILSDLKVEAPELPVILLSAEEDPQLVQQALQQGASGFITKTSSAKVMVSAIKLVLSGGVYVPPLMVAPPVARPVPRPMGTGPKPTVDFKITERQQDVLSQMGLGLSNKEIARELDMSPSTVKVHVAAILKELDVKNRTQAVSKARDIGLID